MCEAKKIYMFLTSHVYGRHDSQEHGPGVGRQVLGQVLSQLVQVQRALSVNHAAHTRSPLSVRHLG